MPRFLVIQAARFGDLLQTKRLILSLERLGRVHLLCDTGLASLAALLYPAVETHAFYFHAPQTECVREHNSRTLTDLADLSFDTVYNCNLSPLSNALCHLFPRERTVGYRPNAVGRTERMPLLQRVARMTAMRSTAAFNLEDVWAHLVSNPVPADEVNPRPKPGGGGLGIILAGREERRSIPPNILADLASVYVQTGQFPHLYLLGTAQEKKLAHAIRRLLPSSLQPRTEDLCGRTGWKELLDCVASLDLVLTPDTGTMHLAAHLGAPVQAFFFSSASCHETGPYGTGHRIIQVAPPCAPCLESAPCQRELLCHKAMEGRDFLRYVTAMARGKDIPAPPHIQFFETATDALGVHCILRSGHDPMASQRRFIRALLLEEYADGETVLPKNPGEEKLMELLFVQDRDWMINAKSYV
ncbi:MAG: glycosyltransferase family 9 protein [Desulfovibrio sp.]|nr:glycosyltransferase family 9 protein [Desulfovibrio sp.]